MPTQAETYFYLIPHTAARTVTLAQGDAPNNGSTFVGLTALTIPANATYIFTLKVIQNASPVAGNSARWYIDDPDIGGMGDGTITPAKFAIVAPTLIAGGDLHHPDHRRCDLA